MFLKRYSFLLICLLLYNSINGQQKTLQQATDLLLNGELKPAKKIIDSLLNTNVTEIDKGYLLLRRATIYRMKAENEVFLKDLETVFTLAKKTKSKVLEADALMQKVTYLNGKQGQGLPALAKYVAIAEETKNPRLLYNANIALTAYSLKGNDTEKARKFHKKALKANSNDKNATSKKEHLDLVYANILSREKKYDSAIFYLKKVLVKATKLKKNISKAQALSILGNRALQNKSYEKSFEWSLQSYQLANKINYRLFVESSFANMFLLLVEVESTDDSSLKEKIYRFFEANSFKSAVLNVEQNLPKIKKAGQRIKILNALSSSFKKIGNLKKAFFYKEEWSKRNIEQLEKNQLNVTKFMNLELAISNLNKETSRLKIENQLNFTHKIILILSIVLLVILSLFIWSQQRLKIKSERFSKLSVEKSLLDSKKKRIQLEDALEQKEEELNSFIKDMIEKNSQIEILENKLKDTSITDLKTLKEELKSKKYSATKNWIEFMFKFKQLYPTFLEKLKTNIPNISPTETRLSILAFLNLSSKQSGSLLGISATSVNQGKYRLKKKINLDKDISLYNYIQKLQSKAVDKP